MKSLFYVSMFIGVIIYSKIGISEELSDVEEASGIIETHKKFYLDECITHVDLLFSTDISSGQKKAIEDKGLQILMDTIIDHFNQTETMLFSMTYSVHRNRYNFFYASMCDMRYEITNRMFEKISLQIAGHPDFKVTLGTVDDLDSKPHGLWIGDKRPKE